MSDHNLSDRPKRGFSMQARLVVFALLCALPVFLLTGLDFLHETERLRARANEEVEDTADLVVPRLQQDLVSTETVAHAVGALDLTQPGASEACSKALERAVAIARPRVTNFAVISPAGDVLCSGLPLLLATNVFDQPHVRQAFRTGRPALSVFMVDGISGKGSLQLAIPVLGPDNRVKVVLGTLTAASLVTDVPEEDDLPVTLGLFDRAGVLVARSPDIPSLRPGRSFAQSELFARRNALQQPVELRGLDGVPRVFTARAVQFHGETVLWVTSGADGHTLSAATRGALWRQMGIVLLMAFAVASVALLATRSLVLQPHEQELEQAMRLAPLGSWFRDAGSGADKWSTQTYTLFGQDPALGPPSRGAREKMLTPDSLARLLVAERTALEHGERFELEIEVIRPDGKTCWLLCHGEAVRGPLGRVTGLRGTMLGITERKLSALAVQRSQRQLRSLMDGLAPSMFVGLLTPEGILVEVNRSPLEAAGITAEDVLGQPFPDTPWWRSWPLLQNQLHAAIVRAAQGEASQFEVRIHGRKREVIDLDFSLQPLRDETGQVIFLIPSAVDITERNRTEKALRASESEFRALAESMPQIVWMTRPDGWNIYFNHLWSDYTGLTLEESSGHGWSKPFHPEDRQRAQDAWQQATTTGTTYMLEARLRRADGAYRWWLLRGIPQRDAAGTLVKWVGTCTDIHDLKQAELAITRANVELKQQQNELRLLFDLMPALIMFKDTENRILRINCHGAEAAGRPVAQIEGRLAQDIFPAAGAEAYVADLEVIRSGKPQLGTVAMVRDRHGKDMWLQRDRVPYRDASGKIIGIVLMAQDITQRKRDQDALRDLNADLEARVSQRTSELSVARSEAEEASLAKSDFLATMSHEIRTPMSGLLGLLELLELSALDEAQHSTLALARESGASLLSIIDDVLDFSKIEAKRLDLHLMASSVRGIVENTCRLHSQVASSKNLSLHVDVAPQVSPLLAVDPLRLGQILNNFLSNAIKFTERGSVEVRVELVGREQEVEQLRFVVRDTGVGMSQQQLDRLFQPFSQADAAVSAKFGGTGLGLVIARRLAELMGGTVEIASEPGCGTTLTLLLSLEICDPASVVIPLVRTPRETLAALVQGRRSAPSPQVAEAEGTLVLVVDDHPTNRQVLLGQLASLGYAAVAAVDGVEALALWQDRRFGAVITDCNMPRMNGYQLATQIRCLEQQGKQGRVPMIACTANALQSAADLCIAAGMDDCLVKPADLAKVSKLLDRWLPLARAGTPGRPPGARPAPGPAIAASAAEGLLDTALLAEISGGSAAVTAQILGDFRHANELDATALRQAAAKEDFAPVVEFSHRIKGATLMLGAGLLSEVCGRVEAAGAAGDPAGLCIAMGSFEAELLRLNAYLDTLA
jgi:PAS domain S-box-containing protein